MITLPFREFDFLWRVVARYDVLHLHFMMTLTRTGWELPFLKLAGRKMVVHFRGCEARDRERNMALHPDVNICQACDYVPPACKLPVNAMRRRLASKYGDYVLVTMPDMKDFVPEAQHLPFFVPEIPASEVLPARRGTKPFKIVHATNHPGIEGTKEIAAAIERLRARGHAIDFVFLRNVPHERVLAELRDADLSIGKMKMGYYANVQIESMALGVPAVTYVRPEFMTDALRNSGFILCRLLEFEETLEYYLTHDEALARKRRIARDSILRLHDNNALAARLIDIYRRLDSAGSSSTRCT